MALAIDGKTLRNAIDEHGTQVHVMSVVGHDTKTTYTKKSRPEAGADDETKRTNEIGTVIPLLDQIEDIGGKTLTADALLTQRKLAAYLLERNADYLLTVKNNQPTLAARYCPALRHRGENPTRLRGTIHHRARTHRAAGDLDHHRPQRAPQLPWRRPSLHDPPRTAQQSNRKGQHRNRLRRHKPHPDTANAQNILTLNRGHWCIENTAHHCLDRSWDEDRSRIRTGNGPENTTRLRRFAIGLIKARGLEVAQTLRKLNRNVRCVFDFLKMTANTQPLPNR